MPDRHKETYQPLIHTPNALSGWGWARPQAGAQNPTWVSSTQLLESHLLHPRVHISQTWILKARQRSNRGCRSPT